MVIVTTEDTIAISGNQVANELVDIFKDEPGITRTLSRAIAKMVAAKVVFKILIASAQLACEPSATEIDSAAEEISQTLMKTGWKKMTKPSRKEDLS